MNFRVQVVCRQTIAVGPGVSGDDSGYIEGYIGQVKIVGTFQIVKMNGGVNRLLWCTPHGADEWSDGLNIIIEPRYPGNICANRQIGRDR